MDPKLAMLFLLFGTIIGLSHLSHLKRRDRAVGTPFWRRRLPKWPPL